MAAIVSGERILGSWWGHRRGHEIFNVLNHLNAHPDVLVTRLVSGKVTYLHRRLWSSFLTIATSEDDWQVRVLSRDARKLLALVRKKGELRMDRLTAKGNPQSLARAARELEVRLLVYSNEVHTETGAHSKILMPWPRCPKLRGFRREFRPVAEAQSTLDAIVSGLNDRYGATARLPWWPTKAAVVRRVRRDSTQAS